MKIGLLGGSFNPAHAGHVHLSKEACKRLGLHQVWWVISPQNPLKSPSEIADYALRLQKARALVKRHPHIKICEIERQRRLRYTVDTLQALQRQYRHQFVWLMGADNLAQFHRWRQWREIFRMVPVAVFDRGTAGTRALQSKAALTFAQFRRESHRLGAKTPCWAYIWGPKHPESATRLRNMLGKAAFLEHNQGE